MQISILLTTVVDSERLFESLGSEKEYFFVVEIVDWVFLKDLHSEEVMEYFVALKTADGQEMEKAEFFCFGHHY